MNRPSTRRQRLIGYLLVTAAAVVAVVAWILNFAAGFDPLPWLLNAGATVIVLISGRRSWGYFQAARARGETW